eukprot:2434358-Pyramimonas_sp.AAC.1
MGSAMQLVQGRLLELGLELRFPVRDAGFIDVGTGSSGSPHTYNDYSMDMVAKTLLSIAPYLAGITFDFFAERGMRLHSGRGKSAALYQFRGPGAINANLALWKHADGIVHTSSSAYGQFQLHAVRQYTHLGT